MHKFRKRLQRGLSMIELIVTVCVLAIFLAAYLFGFKQSVSSKNRTERSLAANTELLRAFEHIQNIGKMAGGDKTNTCQKAGAMELICFVDFDNPPDGTAIQVRFIHDGNDTLRYEVQESGEWNPKITYQKISGFSICNDDDIVNQTCPIEPTAISQAHRRRLMNSTVAENRFFRFRLWETNGDNHRVGDIQSAFYNRNGPGQDLIYQWGSRYTE